MAKATESSAVPASSGVEELITKLRDQGVQAGRSKADEIIREAEKKAEDTIRQAQQKAETIVTEARDEAETLKTAGEEALRIATRDTALRFREDLMNYLKERVQRLVSAELENKELLAKLLAEIARQASQDAGLKEADKVEVLLPANVLGLEELRRNPEELEGELSQWAKQVASATWREGVTFKPLDPGGQGIRVVLTDKGIEIDLSDKAITDMLLQHLQPRFRALMEGIIE